MKTLLTIFVVCLFLFSTVAVEAVERRRDQFSEEPGYVVVPAPYSLPGIGTGIVYFGVAANIADTNLDVYGYKITGDAAGTGYGFDELFLFPKTVSLHLGREDISRATVNSYEKRGMDSDKDDYKLLEASNIHSRYGTLSVMFFNKMLQLYASADEFTADLDRIRDKDGEIIADFEKAQKIESESTTFGINIDYTDDNLDPRSGLRLDVNRSYTPPDHGANPEFFVMNYSASLYIPIGRISTWVFHYFRSDAVVINEGMTDKDTLEEELGINCEAIPDPTQRSDCEKSREEIVNDRYAANKYGTATSLGGRSRLRSYPDGRFSGAHSQMFGTEFRLNLIEEFTPFDIWFMKDIRTGIQLAFFYEYGSVAEIASELGKENRASYGVGARAVMASGIVYRADIATGDEGAETTIIIDYPW